MSKTSDKSVLAESAGDFPSSSCIAFAGPQRIAAGDLTEVASKVKEAMNNPECGPILIFDAESSKQVEIDLRGSVHDVLSRLARALPLDGSHPAKRQGPGRPKLGVVGREVTLLPRHWDWLDSQPGGASVALRKLVEQARHTYRRKDIARNSQDSVYRFMSDMAGDLPGFEEALRAFYRGNEKRVDELIAAWPPDVRDHISKLVAKAHQDQAEALKA